MEASAAHTIDSEPPARLAFRAHFAALSAPIFQQPAGGFSLFDANDAEIVLRISELVVQAALLTHRQFPAPTLALGLEQARQLSQIDFTLELVEVEEEFQHLTLAQLIDLSLQLQLIDLVQLLD